MRQWREPSERLGVRVPSLRRARQTRSPSPSRVTASSEPTDLYQGIDGASNASVRCSSEKGSTKMKGITAHPEHQHTPQEERAIREAALDETIEDTFPASDPPSTIP